MESKRIHIFSKTFRLAEMLFHAHGKGRSKETADAILKYVEEQIAPDPYTIYRMGTGERAKEYVTDEVIKAMRMAGIAPRSYGVPNKTEQIKQ